MQLIPEQIYNQAIQLPNEAKIAFVEKLLENIGDSIDSNIEALQIKEAKRRRDDVRFGHVKPVPGQDALKHVRNMLDEK